MRPNSEEEIFNRDLTFFRANVELLAGPPESVAPFWVAPATGAVRENIVFRPDWTTNPLKVEPMFH